MSTPGATEQQQKSCTCHTGTAGMLKKVRAGRHARTARTHTGKWGAGSVRAAGRPVRGSAPHFVQKGVLGDCGAEPLPAAETGEAEQGQPSKYASGLRSAPHIWATATRSSAPVFASGHRPAPQKSAKRKRNAVCLLQGRHDACCKNREPQPKGFLPRGCAQKLVPLKHAMLNSPAG